MAPPDPKSGIIPIIIPLWLKNSSQLGQPIRWADKGQLFSKCLFYLHFSQKTNKNKSTWGIIVVKLNSFVCFLEETSAWKNHFDLVWPLLVSHSWVILKKNVRKSTWGTLYIQFSISKSHKAHFENNVLHDLSWHNLEVLSADIKAEFSVKISWKYFQIVTSENCAKYCLMDFSI